jgi:hypothetical protein
MLPVRFDSDHHRMTMVGLADSQITGLETKRLPFRLQVAPLVANFLAISAGIAATIFVCGVLAHQGVTPDFPWLKAAGDWIIRHGQLPGTDVFSWTAGQRSWVLYQWGFEVLTAATTAIVGHAGVVILCSWLTLACYLLIPLWLQRNSIPLLLVAGVAAVALGTVTFNLSLRPMIATTAGLLAQYVLIALFREGRLSLRASAGWIGLLYAAWANLHTGFVLGFASLALVLIGDTAERQWPSTRPVGDGSALKASALFTLILAAFLGSLLNPYGIGVHRYILALSLNSYFNHNIEELASADFSFFQFKLMLAMVITLIAGLMRAPKALRPADLLHLLVFTVATILAARFVVWTMLYYVLLLPTVLAHAWPSSTEPRFRRGETSLLIVLSLTSLMAAPVLAASGLADTIGENCRLLASTLDAYLADRRSTDRLLTDPMVGSCLIGAAPGVPVFIDTRFDFYGAEFVQRTMRTLLVQSGWRALIDGLHVDVAVLERRWPLAQAITQDGRFKILHEDEDAVLVRRVPDTAVSPASAAP